MSYTDKEEIQKRLVNMKSYEYYMALAAAVVAVFARHQEKSLISRAVIAGVSALMALSLSDAISIRYNVSETLVVFAIGLLGYGLIDIALGVITDREAITKAILTRIGGHK